MRNSRKCLLAAVASAALASTASADFIWEYRQAGVPVTQIDVNAGELFELELWGTITDPSRLTSAGYNLSVTGPGAAFDSIELNTLLPVAQGPDPFSFVVTQGGGMGPGEFLFQTLTFEAGDLGSISTITFTYDPGNSWKFVQGLFCEQFAEPPEVETTAVPAPGAFALMAMGSVVGACWRRRIW